MRYLFGLPVAVLYALTLAGTGVCLPVPSWQTLGWASAAAAGQVAGTWFLLRALEERNFAVGVAFSKTDVIQAALFEALVLGAAISHGAIVGIIISTFAVMLMSSRGAQPLRALMEGITERPALFGLASGAAMALASIAVSITVKSMPGGVLGAAPIALILVLTMQVTGMGLYLAMREAGTLAKIRSALAPSVLAGIAGGLASLCWFAALALQHVAYVRTLGLVEILATLLLSRFLFGERPTRREVIGIAVLAIGIALVLNAG